MHSVKQCMFTVLREQKPDWKQLNYPISIELILHLFAVQDDGRVTIKILFTSVARSKVASYVSVMKR